MTIPLVILAVLSLVGGWSLGGFGLKSFYQGWLEGTTQTIGLAGSAARDSGLLLEMIIPSAVVLLGVGVAFLLYRGRATDPLYIDILANKFYVDEMYDRSLVGGQQVTARVVNWFDAWILDGLIIRGSAYLSVGLGEILRLFQTGSLQGYAFLFGLGGLLLIYFTIFH
jgi:NADH-quinone oxidoreductase subunit L